MSFMCISGGGGRSPFLFIKKLMLPLCAALSAMRGTCEQSVKWVILFSPLWGLDWLLTLPYIPYKSSCAYVPPRCDGGG